MVRPRPGGRAVLERCPASCCRCSPPARWAAPAIAGSGQRGAVTSPRPRSRRRRPADRRLPGLPRLQRVEPRRLAGAGRPALRRLHRARSAPATASCTRTSAPAVRRLRHPVSPRRRATPAARADPLHRLRRRVRPRPVPDPATRRVEGGVATATCSSSSAGRCRLYELFGARARGRAGTAGSGAVFDLRSNACAPTGWTSADAAGLPILPGPRALRRGRRRRDQPRAALHRAAHAARLHPPARHCAPARHRSDAAADGPAPAAQGGYVQLSGYHGPGARDPAALKTLRDDPRRQRLAAGTSAARRTAAGTTTT